MKKHVARTAIGLILAVALAWFVSLPALAQAPTYQFATGQQTVTTGLPATAVALSSSSLRVPWVMIRGLAANSSNEVYVGNADVTSSNGFELQAGEWILFGDRNAEAAGIDLNDVYIVGTTSVGVSFIYPVFQ